MGLSSSERETIKKVLVNSIFICLLVVGGLWVYHYYSKTHKKSLTHQLENTIIPLDLEAHRLIAQQYCDEGVPEKALPHLERLLSLRPDERLPRYLFATSCIETGQYERALDALLSLEKTAVNADSLTPHIMAQKGMALFCLNRIEESRQCLQACLTQFPSFAKAYGFMGRVEAASSSEAASPSSSASPSGAKNNALQYFERAIALDSLDVDGWYEFGRYVMQLGNYQKAIKLLGRAIEIDPRHEKSFARLGMLYYYRNDFRRAEKMYVAALNLNPKDATTRYNLGELYYSIKNDTAAALREFTAALRENPDHAEANYKTGLICLSNNMVKEAIRYFTTALKNSPEDVRVMLLLGVAFEKLGDRQSALQTYRDIVTIDPINAIAKQKVANLSRQL